MTTSGDLILALNGPAPVGSGVAELLQYSGALHGTGSSAFALNTSGVSGLGARALLSLSFSNAGFVKLKYSLDHPVWSGAGDGTWITSPSVTATGTTNWVLASSPSTVTNFIQGDAPLFDDTAGTGTTTVKINAANVAPLSTIFNNNSLSYTLTGAFGIAGSGSLTMNGSGSLTIATSDGYTGGTTLNAGLLNINNNSALGSGAFTIGGGSIDSTTPGVVLANNPHSWNGDFTFLGSNNLNLGSGSVTLGGNRQVTVNAGTLTVGGGISGGFGLTLPGPGALALTGSSTYSGDTAINGGTLTVGGAGVLGNGAYAGGIAIASGAALNFNSSANQTFGGVISGSGNLVAAGPGTLTLTGSNDAFSGNASVTAGALTLNSGSGTAAAFILAGDTSLAVANGTCSLNSNSAIHFQSTSSTLTIGPNGLVLANNSLGTAGNFYNQYWLTNLSMQGGTLAANYPGNSSYGNFTIFTGGAVTTSGGSPSTISAALGLYQPNTTFNIASDSPLLVSGAITLATAGAGLTMAGPGVMTVTGTNTYTGATTISGGTLNVTGAGVLGSGSYPGAIDIAAGAALIYSSSANQKISGVISDAGNLNVSAGSLVLSGSNTIAGTITLTGGVLNLGSVDTGSTGPLGTASVVLGGGTLQYSSVNNTDYSGRITAAAGQAYNVDTNGQNVTWNTGLTSTGGSLDKLGGGTLALNGANTYSGATAVNGGKLYLNNTNMTSSITVAGGAALGGSGATSAAVNVADGGAVEAGYSGSGSLALGGLNFNNTGTINVANFANYSTSAAITVRSGGLSTSGALTINLGGPAPAGAGTAETPALPRRDPRRRFQRLALNTAGVTGLGIRTFFALSFSNAGFVDLNYNIDHPIWSGAGNGTWITSAGTTATGVTNWVLASSPSTATNFIQGDAAVFDDTAGTGTTTVNISAANVSPASVVFNNNSLSYTLTGAFGITGSTSLAMNGGGSLTIANTNSYTGGTLLNAGLLNLNNASALGSGPFTINGGTANSNAASNNAAGMTLNAGLLELNNNLALGSGTFTINGGAIDSAAAGIVLANGTQAWNGDFTFLGSNNLNLGSGTMTLGSDRIVTVNAGTLTVGGNISGTHALVLAGAGTLLLTGSSTYTGATGVGSGTMTIGGAGVLGNGTYSGNIGIAAGAVLNYNSSANQTFRGNISGAGNLVASGPGTLNWSSVNNSLTGGVYVSGGVLAVTGNGGVTSSIFGTNTPITFYVGSGGVLRVSGSYSLGGPDITQQSLDIQGGTLDMSPNSSDVGYGGRAYLNTITFDTAPGQIISSNGSGFRLGASQSPTITVASAASGSVISSNLCAVFRFSGNSTVLMFNVASGSAAGGDLTVSGSIFDPPAGSGFTGMTVTKADVGSLVLTGFNNYASATTISGGTLAVGGSGVLGGGNYGGAIDIAGGATFDYASSAAQTLSGDITDSGNLVMAGAGVLTLTGTNTYSGGTFVSNGTLIVTSPDALLDGSDLTVESNWPVGASAPLVPSHAASANAAAVPEPGTFVLLLVGGLLVLMAYRTITIYRPLRATS